jgi:hypothetical protein
MATTSPTVSSASSIPSLYELESQLAQHSAKLDASLAAVARLDEQLAAPTLRVPAGLTARLIPRALRGGFSAYARREGLREKRARKARGADKAARRAMYLVEPLAEAREDMALLDEALTSECLADGAGAARGGNTAPHGGVGEYLRNRRWVPGRAHNPKAPVRSSSRKVFVRANERETARFFRRLNTGAEILLFTAAHPTHLALPGLHHELTLLEAVRLAETTVVADADDEIRSLGMQLVAARHVERLSARHADASSTARRENRMARERVAKVLAREKLACRKRELARKDLARVEMAVSVVRAEIAARRHDGKHDA